MRHPEHAAKLWPILVELAKGRQLETYGGIALEMGLIAQGVSSALKPIHAYCLANNFPLLTALVVRADSRRPGGGYRSANDHQTECERVFAHDWSTVRGPSALDFAKAIAKN